MVPPSGWKRHEEVLRSYRRCFYCGQPLREPSLDQRCPACGKAVLQGEQSVDRYDAYIGRRRGWTFAAVVVLGVVPILGPLLASSLYRRTLINPYSLYMTVYRESFLMVVLFSVPSFVSPAAVHRHHRHARPLRDGIPPVPAHVPVEGGEI